jgi:hypothetical protein
LLQHFPVHVMTLVIRLSPIIPNYRFPEDRKTIFIFSNLATACGQIGLTPIVSYIFIFPSKKESNPFLLSLITVAIYLFFK